MLNVLFMLINKLNVKSQHRLLNKLNKFVTNIPLDILYRLAWNM